ncbi:hypothetical protein ABK040_009734 [Willaertia magna]
MSERIVTLNIGGTKFITTADTLLSEYDTFFSDLILFLEKNNYNFNRNNNNELFVDRNPSYFHVILNHLRGYNVYSEIQTLNYYEKQKLAQDVTFYNIESMFKYFPLLSLAETPNRKIVAFDGHNRLFIYDLNSKRIVHVMENESVAFIEKLGEHCDYCLTFSAGEIKLWDLRFGTLITQQCVGQDINEIQLLETNNENQFYILLNGCQLWFVNLEDCSINCSIKEFKMNDFGNLTNLKENSFLVISSFEFLVKKADNVERYSAVKRKQRYLTILSTYINNNGFTKNLHYDEGHFELQKVGLTLVVSNKYSLDVNRLELNSRDNPLNSIVENEGLNFTLSKII